MTEEEDARLETHELRLRPLKGRNMWKVSIDPSLVRLQDPDGHDALIVPREDIAQYMQFQRDVFRGRTVTFAAAYGMKPYVFHCEPGIFEELFSWMPRKSPQELARSVQLNGIAIALVGVAYLLLPKPINWWWGVVLLAFGAGNMIRPKRLWHLFNALALFVIGLSELFVTRVIAANPTQLVDTFEILKTVAGIVFICWGIQQFAMLSPNAQIRAARVKRSPDSASLPKRRSPLVRRTAVCALAASVLLWAYALSLVYVTWRGIAMVIPERSLGGVSLGMVDIVASSVLGTVCLASGLVLLKRRLPAYAEAKIVSQMLISLALVFWWGAVFSFDPAQPVLLLGTLFSNGLSVFGKPYVWASFLAAVLVLNWLFARAVDKELAQGLD